VVFVTWEKRRARSKTAETFIRMQCVSVGKEWRAEILRTRWLSNGRMDPKQRRWFVVCASQRGKGERIVLLSGVRVGVGEGCRSVVFHYGSSGVKRVTRQARLR
jgi:hypothetical protein